ncbi:LysR substrate-binding domain-containing protein [Bradyrhizobium sp. UFLA05-109]
MDRIDSMGVFAKVVEKQSFSGAARELRLSQAVVSKHVRALEDWLGAQLLNRTTRRLNVTEIGALVYERCERILDEIDEVRQSTSALQTAPRGVLHLAAPVSFGVTQLGPVLADYLSRYPEVVVDVTLGDRFIDLVEEGFDLALRVGELKDSSLIARRLAPVRFVLCASPLYVKRHGAPREPADLANHRCLFYSLRAIPGEWRFKGPEGEVSLRIGGRFRSNNGNMLHAAMLGGAGIGLAPTFVVGKDLAEGRLVSLMPNYRPIESERSAIYPPGKILTAKVRSLIDFLAARFGPEPPWDTWRTNNGAKKSGTRRR